MHTYIHIYIYDMYIYIYIKDIYDTHTYIYISYIYVYVSYVYILNIYIYTCMSHFLIRNHLSMGLSPLAIPSLELRWKRFTPLTQDPEVLRTWGWISINLYYMHDLFRFNLLCVYIYVYIYR